MESVDCYKLVDTALKLLDMPVASPQAQRQIGAIFNRSDDARGPRMTPR